MTATQIPLLDAHATATRLRVPVGVVRRWLRLGLLPGVELPNGQIRVDEQQLQTWLLESSIPMKGKR